MSFDDLINKEELQSLQDAFCHMTGFFAYCVDADKKMLSELSGEEKQLERAAVYFSAPIAALVLDRVLADSLEEIAIEELEDGRGRIAALRVRADEECEVYFLVLELYELSWLHRDSFSYALELLQLGNVQMLLHRLEIFNAEIENRRSESAREKMQESMDRIEATTAVVQLLDSDEPEEKLLTEWLKSVCTFLNMDSAQVFRLLDDAHMDIASEWRRPGTAPKFRKKTQLPSYSFLYTDKPIIMTGEKFAEAYGAETKDLGLEAVMIFPVYQNKQGGSLVLSLNHRKTYAFTNEDIKFAGDAVRILQNIIVKRKQKSSLINSVTSLEAIMNHMESAVCVVDDAARSVLFANRRLRSSFGELLQREDFFAFLDKSRMQVESQGESEVLYAKKDIWYDFTAQEISWVDGRKVTLYCLYDITDKKLYQRKIEQQVYTDSLTGLYNRTCCERDLTQFVYEAKEKGETGALLYLDLDDFKHINDSLGHQYGDVLLKAIAHALQRVEGVEDTCYRMGGDEFVILVSAREYEHFEEIVTKIQEIFDKPWYLKNSDYYCTMSMGIVQFPGDGDTVMELVKKADIAMYEAKKGGKNQIVCYSDNIGEFSDRRLDMEKHMRDASQDGYREFVVYYQPIIDVQGEEIECAGAEALIRWNSANMGFISPAEFIPLAEYLGLINPIGDYVLQEACKSCKRWNEHGYPHYKVNVNLSVVQLLQPDIVARISSTIKETGINPANLTLEVTESLAIDDMDRMKEILGRIKALGVKLALDDFGTGYSSLNHIREIPFDVIKVDQSFVKDLAQDEYAKSFVKMVAELAEAIGVSICVEGIETINQYAVLNNMKVKYIQGYFFDKPMPCEEFEKKYVQ